MKDTEVLQAINNLDWAILHLQKYTLKIEHEDLQKTIKTIESIKKIKNKLAK